MDYHQYTDQTEPELDMISGDMPEDLAQAAAAAEAQKAAAQKEPEAGAYVHRLKAPLVWKDKTYETLTFQWDALTGKDHLAIEDELLMRGKTLVVPEYTGDYLCGMAVRACAELKDLVLPDRRSALEKLPLGDFMDICGRARSFLFHARRQDRQSAPGSGSKA